MVNIIEISNRQYEKECWAMHLIYGFHDSPFGECLLAVTAEEKAVCFLWFLTGSREDTLQVLKIEWPEAPLMEDESVTGLIIGKIFSDSDKDDLTVLLRGTELQIKAWKAFMNIPRGEVRSAWTLATDLGCPKSIFVITSAIKCNRIGFLVPCHRIISHSPSTKWGEAWLQMIDAYEEEKNC